MKNKWQLLDSSTEFLKTLAQAEEQALFLSGYLAQLRQMSGKLPSGYGSWLRVLTEEARALQLSLTDLTAKLKNLSTVFPTPVMNEPKRTARTIKAKPKRPWKVSFASKGKPE